MPQSRRRSGRSSLRARCRSSSAGHSIAEPDVRAAAKPHGPVGLIQFDTHTDTWPDVLGAELSHGTPMFRLVEAGVVDPTRYVQIGIRGYTHDEEVWAWQRERGITTHPMHEVHDRGLDAVLADTIAQIGAGPAFLTVDVAVERRRSIKTSWKAGISRYRLTRRSAFGAGTRGGRSGRQRRRS